MCSNDRFCTSRVPKLISRKIWVIKILSNFHIVYVPGMYLTQNYVFFSITCIFSINQNCNTFLIINLKPNNVVFLLEKLLFSKKKKKKKKQYFYDECKRLILYQTSLGKYLFYTDLWMKYSIESHDTNILGLIPNSLCSRNFQNVKLRLHDMDIFRI